MVLWTVKYTPLLKEYLPITELSQQSFVWIYVEIRNKQLKLHDMTSPHLQIVIQTASQSYLT